MSKICHGGRFDCRQADSKAHTCNCHNLSVLFGGSFHLKLVVTLSWGVSFVIVNYVNYS